MAPAISKCGMDARSTIKFSLSIFFPIAIGRLKLLCWNFSDASRVRMLTTVFFTFGTSIPIVPLPGIGAMIRIPKRSKTKRNIIFQILDP